MPVTRLNPGRPAETSQDNPTANAGVSFVMSIPFVRLDKQHQLLESSIKQRIDTVFEHGRYIMGPEVAELEDKLRLYTGSKHCITVASGTEALLISLMALGVGEGDEVITTPFTFVSTVEVIVLLGAKPVFVDIEKDTCNIDSSLLAGALSPNTRAIIPVSLYGQPADMHSINDFAEKHNLTVIEDSAQSFGAVYEGRRSCNLSLMACTSFFPSKPLGCYGDGGAIFTNDDVLAQACREIRVHGQSERYVHTRVGVGGRMDTLQCAILLAKLEVFDNEIENRTCIGSRYNHLIDEAGIERVVQRPGRSSVFAQYTVFVDNRDEIIAKLKHKGVSTAVHYPVPLNEQPAYRALGDSQATPIASELSKRVMSLPMCAYLEENDQFAVVSELAYAVGAGAVGQRSFLN